MPLAALAPRLSPRFSLADQPVRRRFYRLVSASDIVTKNDVCINAGSSLGALHAY